MGSEPSDDVEGTAVKPSTPAQRAWGAFNAQGGLAKILIGSATAALTAFLIALPGLVSGWVGGSDEPKAVESDDGNSSPTGPAAAPTTPATSPPDTTAPPDATTPPDTKAPPGDDQQPTSVVSEPTPVAVDIEDVRIRSDETLYYLDILLAPPTGEITVNHLGIAETHTREGALPCTGGDIYQVELGDTAVGQSITDDVTTFVFSQSELGSDGETLVQGEVALSGEYEPGCSSPYTRFVLRPQLVTGAGQRVQLEARIPRTISYVGDDGVTPESFDPFPGYGQPLGGTLSIAVGTTDGACAWYPADLSQVGLPRIEPPTPEALGIENCPEQ